MEITLKGVLTKLSADEIISALLSDEAKGLYELKKALDKLEAQELFEPSEEDIAKIPFFSDAEINEMLSQENNSGPLHFEQPKKRAFSLESDIKFTPSDEKSFDGEKKTFFEHDEVGQFPSHDITPFGNLIKPVIEEKPSSDPKVPPTPKKSSTIRRKTKKRKYHHKPVKKETSAITKPAKKSSRKHKRNKKRSKKTVVPQVEKIATFVSNKPGHIVNDEDSPTIVPAKRPRENSYEMNV